MLAHNGCSVNVGMWVEVPDPPKAFPSPLCFAEPGANSVGTPRPSPPGTKTDTGEHITLCTHAKAFLFSGFQWRY